MHAGFGPQLLKYRWIYQTTFCKFPLLLTALLKFGIKSPLFQPFKNSFFTSLCNGIYYLPAVLTWKCKKIETLGQIQCSFAFFLLFAPFFLIAWHPYCLYSFFIFSFNLEGCCTISLGSRISITSKSHCIPDQQLLLQKGKFLNSWSRNARANGCTSWCACSIFCRLKKKMLGWTVTPQSTLWLSLEPFIYSHQQHSWHVFKFIWVNYRWMEYFGDRTNLSLIY